MPRRGVACYTWRGRKLAFFSFFYLSKTSSDTLNSCFCYLPTDVLGFSIWYEKISWQKIWKTINDSSSFGPKNESSLCFDAQIRHIDHTPRALRAYTRLLESSFHAVCDISHQKWAKEREKALETPTPSDRDRFTRNTRELSLMMMMIFLVSCFFVQI